MDWKPKDWIEHAAFGIGQVSEDRGDKLDIDFVSTGRKTLLKSTELKPATPLSPDFKFPHNKVKPHATQFKVKNPPSHPSLDFNHLVECFVRCFDGGFDSQDFQKRERGYKEKAASLLKDKLDKYAFENFLRDGHYAEVCEIAKTILQSTNLAYPIEKAKFLDGIKIAENQERFASALYDLLHGSAEMEQRFTKFCDLLSEMGANKWTVATYYQFLATNGKWMFMKPKVTQRMAESLNIALNYKPEPNWLTYSKLQELADRVDLELQKRKLKQLEPHSRIDVQGLIWASIQIEAGKYKCTNKTK
jgi:hypothetical protein